MKKTLIILVLLLVGFTMKAYSQELPSLFGIELGKPLHKSIEIVNWDSAQYSFDKTKRIINCLESALSDYVNHHEKIDRCKFGFYDLYEVNPPIHNTFFKKYSVKVFDNTVVSIIAEVSGRSCFKNKEDKDKVFDENGELVGKLSSYDENGEYDSITLFEETVLKDIKLKFKLELEKNEDSGMHVHYVDGSYALSNTFFWNSDDLSISLQDNKGISLTEGFDVNSCTLIIQKSNSVSFTSFFGLSDVSSFSTF